MSLFINFIKVLPALSLLLTQQSTFGQKSQVKEGAPPASQKPEKFEPTTKQVLFRPAHLVISIPGHETQVSGSSTPEELDILNLRRPGKTSDKLEYFFQEKAGKGRLFTVRFTVRDTPGEARKRFLDFHELSAKQDPKHVTTSGVENNRFQIPCYYRKSTLGEQGITGHYQNVMLAVECSPKICTQEDLMAVFDAVSEAVNKRAAAILKVGEPRTWRTKEGKTFTASLTKFNHLKQTCDLAQVGGKHHKDLPVQKLQHDDQMYVWTLGYGVGGFIADKGYNVDALLDAPNQPNFRKWDSVLEAVNALEGAKLPCEEAIIVVNHFMTAASIPMLFEPDLKGGSGVRAYVNFRKVVTSLKISEMQPFIDKMDALLTELGVSVSNLNPGVYNLKDALDKADAGAKPKLEAGLQGSLAARLKTAREAFTPAAEAALGNGVIKFFKDSREELKKRGQTTAK